MAATVYLSESNGLIGSEVVTDNVANMNFGQFDGPNMIASQHPINIGQSSTGKWWRIKLQALGGSSQIGTMGLFKASGAYLAGETIGGTPNNSAPGAYSSWFIATYGHSTPGVGGGAVTMPYTANGVEVMGNSGYLTYPVSTAFANQVWAPGNTVLSAAGSYSTYIFMGVLTTLGTTPQGAANQKVFTIQWTEA